MDNNRRKHNLIFKLVSAVVLACFIATSVYGPSYALQRPLITNGDNGDIGAHVYEDASQDFRGIDLDHFVCAQYLLAEMADRPEALEYARLCEGNYNKEIIDEVINGMYSQPRLDVEITKQNENPRLQSISEAVSNSLDAFGLDIGKFKKGIKQILDWLEATGSDRVDVYTKRGRQAYQLTILKAKDGRYYIQINRIDTQEFSAASAELRSISGQEVENGTVVRLTRKEPIPKQTSTDKGACPYSRQAIEEELIDTYRRVRGARIFVHGAQINVKAVEGQRTSNFVCVDIKDNSITIADNGAGMDPQLLSRMFVPKRIDDAPIVNGVSVQTRLEKVSVDFESGPKKMVSFTRNGPVILSIEVGDNLVDEATADGALFIEFGKLLPIPESRKNIRPKLDIKDSNRSGFNKAIAACINQIINNDALSDLDKVKYINTIVVALDKFAEGNENYIQLVSGIHKIAREALAPVIAELEREGNVILPHDKQFERLVLPEGRRPVYLHEKLFKWQGAISLEKAGALLVPGIAVGPHGRKIPLFVMPFKDDILKAGEFDPEGWHLSPDVDNMPIIKTDRFIIIPYQLGRYFYELAAMEATRRSPAQAEDFAVLCQIIKSVCDEEIDTSYEARVSQQTFHIASLEFKTDTGKVDSDAVNSFVEGLSRPPMAARQSPLNIKQEANQRYALLENSDVIEIGTGKVVAKNVVALEYLNNGYYKLMVQSLADPMQGPSRRNNIYFEKIVKLEEGPENHILGTDNKLGRIQISPDKRFAYIAKNDGKLNEHICDLATGKEYFLGSDAISAADMSFGVSGAEYSDLQFSKDGKFMTYIQLGGAGHKLWRKLYIINVENNTKTELYYEGDNYAVNPFANVVFVRNEELNQMILYDLESGQQVKTKKEIIRLHTDSSGQYTTIFYEDGQMALYHHKSKKLIEQINGQLPIERVETFSTRNSPTMIYIYFGKTPYLLTKSGQIKEVNYFNRKGMLESVSLNGRLSFQECDAEGNPAFSLAKSIFDPGTDPLQRLDQKGVYLHPKYNYIIDNSDPKNPKVINPVNNGVLTYKEGEIIVRDVDSPEPASVLFYSGGKIRPEIFMHVSGSPSFVVDGLALENVAHIGAQMKTELVDIVLSKNQLANEWHINGVNRYNTYAYSNRIPTQYSNVSYDGKYLVFVNPKTGDAVYLEPKEGAEPIFVSSGRPQAALLDEKPADAPSEYVVVRKEAGFFISDTTGAENLNLDPSQRPQTRINNKLFIEYTDDGRSYIIKDGEILFVSLQKPGVKHSIVSYTDKFVVFEMRDKTLGEIQFALDVTTGETYPSWAKKAVNDASVWQKHLKEAPRKVQISSSGRYILCEVKDDINCYDIQSGKASWFRAEDYSVCKNCDFMIIKRQSGLYDLFDLSTGAMRLSDKSHIEIDSSGTIAVFSDLLHGTSLGAINLKTDEEVFDRQPVHVQEVWVASDENYCYARYNSALNTGTFDFVAFDYAGNKVDAPVPDCYWEQFGIGHRAITKTNGERQNIGVVAYKDSSPVDPKRESVALYGNIVVNKFFYKKENGFFVRVYDLDNSEILGKYYNNTKMPRMEFLTGNKVWYESDEDGLWLLYQDILHKALVNQTQAYLMLLGTDPENPQAKALVNSEGKIIDIAGLIPEGFIPTDINGEYFVLSNRKGEIKYLDPRQVFMANQVREEQPQPQLFLDKKPADAPSKPVVPKATARKIGLSPSGRYSVSVDLLNKTLVYFDYNEENPKEKIICNIGWFISYLMSDICDVVIVEKAPGKYQLFDLSSGYFIGASDAEHIEIDSTGTFAISRHSIENNHYLRVLNLKTGQHVYYGGELTCTEAQVTCDDNYVYLRFNSMKDKDKFNVQACRRYGIGAMFNRDGDLPDFWESYDLEKKCIKVLKEDKEEKVLTKVKGSQAMYADKSPRTEARATISLYGDMVIIRDFDGDTFSAEVFNLRTGLAGSYYSLYPVNMRSLAGKNAWYQEDEAGIFYNMLEDDSMNKALANEERTFLLVLEADPDNTHAYALIDSKGTVKKIGDLVPEGFVPTDVSGKYFIFTNPENGHIKYLDPEAIITQGQKVETQLSIEEREKQIRLWNTLTLGAEEPPKDLTGTNIVKWINQARSAYEPFLGSIPREYKGHAEDALKAHITNLYNAQLTEIRRRYAQAIAGARLDQEAALPFDKFSQKMRSIMESLPEYINKADGLLAEANFDTQRKFYSNLFTGLFKLCSNADLELGKADSRLFEALACGWEINSKEQLEAAGALAEFIEAMRGPDLNAIETQDLIKIIGFLSNAAAKNPQSKTAIIRGQIRDILGQKDYVKNSILASLKNAFALVTVEALENYLRDPDSGQVLGRARQFIEFLTAGGLWVREYEDPLDPAGEDIVMSQDGVEISRMIKLEHQRHKKGKKDIVMDIDYLIRHIQAGSLPEPSAGWEQEILHHATDAPESGASARETAQNSYDGTRTNEHGGRLEIDFYTRKNRAEYVEEASDNGTGALKEVALLIPVSLKALAEQTEGGGFFGIGKYAIFEGVDSLEIITKNASQAYMFTYEVKKDGETGQPKAIRLTGIRKINDPRVKQGVTVRRIKRVENTMPSLDAMLSQRNWKTFAGLCQDKHLKIYFVYDKNKPQQPLIVEHEVLSEVRFMAIKPRPDTLTDSGHAETLTDFGPMRIMSTKDMPVQLIDKIGVRVSGIKDEYFDLIPKALRDKYVKRLGLVIQLPFKLDLNRDTFEYGAELMSDIQKYIAIEFYKALAYKALTDPYFTLEDYSEDWDIRADRYNDIIDPVLDRDIIWLSEKINSDIYSKISKAELHALKSNYSVDTGEKLMKLIILLKVAVDSAHPEDKISLLGRRLKLLGEAARRQREMLERAGYTVGALPTEKQIPSFGEKMRFASVEHRRNEQLLNIEKYIVGPQTAQEQTFLDLAKSVAEKFGLNNVYLASDELMFGGVYGYINGERAIVLKRNLAGLIIGSNGSSAIISQAAETVLHELGHLLEGIMKNGIVELFSIRSGSDNSMLTHQRDGRWAKCVKKAAVVWLAHYEPLAQEPQQQLVEESVRTMEALESGV